MSPKKTRLHRSELAVPGSNVRMLEKAPDLGADMVMLDLEDAVAPGRQGTGPRQRDRRPSDLDWSAPSVSVRINGLDTHWCYRDIVDVVEQAGEQIDAIVIPKAERGRRRASGRHAALADRAGGRAPADDRAHGPDRDRDRDGQRRRDRAGLPGADGGDDLRGRRLRRLGPGADHLDRRLRRVLLGAHQRGRRRRARAPLGRPVALSAGADRGHLPRHGLRPIDGPYGDFTDPEGYLASARRAAALGLRGQMGDPPIADRARERGLHPGRAAGRQRPAGSSRR